MFSHIPISLLARLYGFGAAFSLVLVLYTSKDPARALGCLSIGWLLAISAIVLSIQAEENDSKSKARSL